MEVSVVERDYKPEAYVHVHIHVHCGMYNIYKSETYAWPNHWLITSKLGHIQRQALQITLLTSPSHNRTPRDPLNR